MSLKRRVVLGCAAALAVASWPAAAQAVPSAQAPAGACPQHSFSRTFTNLTGKTVHGLHLSIHGPKTVDGFHTGPDNPFGAPVFHGLGPDGTYRVRFGGASVAAGQTVRVAFCIDAPAAEMVPLGSSFAQSWLTTEGEEDEPAPEQRLAAVGAVWSPQAAGTGVFQVRVELTNSEAATLQLTSLQWTRLDQPLPLGSLGWEQLDAAATWQTLGAAATLPAAVHDAGSSRTSFLLPASFQFDEPGVLLFRFVAGEPGSASNVVRGAGQVAIASLLRPVFLESRALEVAAGRLGAPASALTIRHRAEGAYPLQGQTTFAFKVGDGAGSLTGVVLDPAGNELDEHQLAAEESQLRATLFGRLDPGLAQRLPAVSPSQSLPVVLWLERPEEGGAPVPPDSVESQEALAAYHAAVDSWLAARTAAVTGPVVSRLQALGHTATPAPFAPAVYTSLTPAAIQQVAQWAEVDRIYEDVVVESLLNIVRPVVRADVLHAAGITGNGIKLGQVEVSGGTTPGNGNLGGVTQDPNSCVDAHGTGVAGIIVSTNATHKGIAYGASLYAAGGCSGAGAVVSAASDRAYNWGALALNASLGSPAGTGPTGLDRFYDTAVRDRRRSTIIAAGNEGCPAAGPPDWRVTTPARGYNMITVGNYDDRNTLGWRDDIMSNCSSYVDPPSTNNDREKPEVSAPGTNIMSTKGTGTGSIGSGTSFAAPVVTGGAGLLFQSDATLGAWPEAVKAILMTTAVHNVEGDDRLSDKDGAGGVVLDHAVATATAPRWGKTANYLCTGAYSQDVQTFWLGGGRRSRVTIVWSTPETYADYDNRPGADLDLQIIDPAGNSVAFSSSWDNTYEIVDFLAQTSGNYKIRVIKYRCSADPKYLAWAWWQADETIVDGAGWDAEGAGIEVFDVNNNGTPDLLLMAYDAPPGANNFRYKIGWDVDNLGRTANWTAITQENGVGFDGQGASLNLVNLDANTRPEMILMAYDNPPGANTFRYKIGWNLTTAGVPTAWTGPIQVGGVGWEGQGAGVEIANLDANPRPEMILVAYDNPPGANTFRYLIGWNLNAAGAAAAWTGPVQIPGAGWEGQGAGVAIANLDGNAQPDMLLMAYDNPPGANTFRYRVGWNLNALGNAASWSGLTQIDGIGWEADGADPRLFDIDADGVQELFLMCYDDPWGPNTFRYRVIEP